ncbi:OLC1v1010917C1 [Oldenlandia corymbosa var. corymbosa]|uniref:OLC1v1010917C1 n=1 Tax=Oldenlandia corymbosa var. corymbosa TaxID=529605 RepID=A0AAV1DSE2_OLDCO|nr:OLC1v1010917C1 [Oldenlandia corymbosa var. corymbosa]
MSESADSKLATAKTVLTTLGSVAATAMVVRSVARECVPQELQDYFYSGIWRFLERFSNQLTMVIDEFDGLEKNEIYEAAEVYLGPKITPTTRRLKISRQEKEKNFKLSMEKGEEITDVYNGVKLNWVWIARKVETRNFYNPRDMNSTLRSEVRSFELTFHKKHQDFVMNVYLPFIVDEAKLRKHEKKTIKILTVDYEQMYDLNSAWISASLDHPANFDTLAMDSEMKAMIMDDLDRFVQRKDYYRKIGKAWKRGYLLYGPPGTGKSSLIAAIANYLNFDIYDLELTEVRRNSDLRKLLLSTANKSVLVVEDIDCTIEFQDRVSNKAVPVDPESGNHQEENKVTLSGFLNFIDGLWSSCGDERIIIFTTNHKEKLDPALLRPGRMDVHIHMSYCTPCGFKILAANYLNIKDHILFKEIEALIATTQVTPAEVAEQLLKTDAVDVTLQGLLDFLHVKRKENEETKAKQVEVEMKDTEVANLKQDDDEKEEAKEVAEQQQS